MKSLRRDGVALAYLDTGSAKPPMLLVHGCGLTHASLAPQIDCFANTHRVIAVDLRGHGKSDAPHQDYTMQLFADDLAWFAEALGLNKPAMVAHSMGGNIALELAYRYPETLSSLVLIDTFLFMPQPQLNQLGPLIEALHGPNFLAAFQQALTALCLPSETRSAALISSMSIPQHVLSSAFANQTVNYDATASAAGCRIPVAYIGSGKASTDLARFQSLTPQLLAAQTLGSGHFSPIEVPDQINAMTTHFLRTLEDRTKEPLRP